MVTFLIICICALFIASIVGMMNSGGGTHP